MRKCLSAVFVFAAAALLLAAPQAASPQDSSSGGTIKIKLDYTGSGTVDENHKIYVALWNSADFMKAGAIPVEVTSSASKTGTATLSNAKADPAYVSVAFDPTGKWDAQSAPPSGSSLGMYSKTPGTPEPIHVASGKTETVSIEFNDAVKVP
ncbi:MAG: hypothetical protein JO340_18520 [Acidobacteriaceae bacterium]|nr:hypothetical protein [Acidobacteriaceae bacterium]